MIELFNPCRCGGNGRHAVLRGQWRKPCRFESGHRHTPGMPAVRQRWRAGRAGRAGTGASAWPFPETHEPIHGAWFRHPWLTHSRKGHALTPAPSKHASGALLSRFGSGRAGAGASAWPFLETHEPVHGAWFRHPWLTYSWKGHALTPAPAKHASGSLQLRKGRRCMAPLCGERLRQGCRSRAHTDVLAGGSPQRGAMQRRGNAE